MGWRSKIERARKLHRPSLKDWECDGLAKEFPMFVDKILNENDRRQAFLPPPSSYNHHHHDDDDYDMNKTNRSHSNNNNNHQHQILPVILHAQTLSSKEFFDRYEAPLIPCIIQGIPAGFDNAQCQADGAWPAVEKWHLTALQQPPQQQSDTATSNIYHTNVLRSRVFKCGEDDDGKSIKIRLKHFLRYLHHNQDDSPLYIFDSSFADDRCGKSILSDYRVPSYFADDLFRLVSESRRPPYRWWLIGPQRSGSTVHIDPLATSAWNTLVHGKKRWVLFPPHVPKHVVKGTRLIGDDEDDEAIHYFMFILPRIKRKAAAALAAMQQQQQQQQGEGKLKNKKKHSHHHYSADYQGFACYEFTQYAGETVFVPSGWWHAVLNLTDTVGVTQNFCSPRNFDAVWRQTRSGRKRMAWKWLCRLEEEYPELALRAKAMNRKDHFRMKYDPAEIKRRQRQEQKRKLQRNV